jgi:hypothetical protein
MFQRASHFFARQAQIMGVFAVPKDQRGRTSGRGLCWALIAFRFHETQEPRMWMKRSESSRQATTRSRCNRMEMEKGTSGYRVCWQGGFERAARGVYRAQQRESITWALPRALLERGFLRVSGAHALLLHAAS